jgi:hypothetical protein
VLFERNEQVSHMGQKYLDSLGSTLIFLRNGDANTSSIQRYVLPDTLTRLD